MTEPRYIWAREMLTIFVGDGPRPDPFPHSDFYLWAWKNEQQHKTHLDRHEREAYRHEMQAYLKRAIRDAGYTWQRGPWRWFERDAKWHEGNLGFYYGDPVDRPKPTEPPSGRVAPPVMPTMPAGKFTDVSCMG